MKRKAIQPMSEEMILKIQSISERMCENFKALKEERHLNNREMADALSPYITSDSHMSRIFSGKRPISIELLAAIHCRFGIDFDEFMLGEKRDADRTILSEEEERVVLNLADRISDCKIGR